MRTIRMCARYTLRTPLHLLAQQFLFDLGGLPADFSLPPRFNIAPTQAVVAIRGDSAGARELTRFHWGLVPSWAKDKKLAYSTINARAETVATKPVFRSAFKHRRCLVLADGYYEWETAGKQKLPWLYEIEGGAAFAFAGLWETWRPAGSDLALESCTILTTTPNELAGQFHDRMPVILDERDYDAWLAGEQIPLVPLAADRISSRRVSQTVNNVRHEGPDCIGPA